MNLADAIVEVVEAHPAGLTRIGLGVALWFAGHRRHRISWVDPMLRRLNGLGIIFMIRTTPGPSGQLLILPGRTSPALQGPTMSRHGRNCRSDRTPSKTDEFRFPRRPDARDDVGFFALRDDVGRRRDDVPFEAGHWLLILRSSTASRSTWDGVGRRDDVRRPAPRNPLTGVPTGVPESPMRDVHRLLK